MSSTAPIIALIIMLGLLVAMTRFGVARIEAAHPPAGQFVEIEGVRLHVAELGLPVAARAPSPPWC